MLPPRAGHVPLQAGADRHPGGAAAARDRSALAAELVGRRAVCVRRAARDPAGAPAGGRGGGPARDAPASLTAHAPPPVRCCISSGTARRASCRRCCTRPPTRSSPSRCATRAPLGPAAGAANAPRAAQVIPVEADEAARRSILLELKTLHECTHPAIVSFYGAFFREAAVRRRQPPRTAPSPPSPTTTTPPLAASDHRSASAAGTHRPRVHGRIPPRCHARRGSAARRRRRHPAATATAAARRHAPPSPAPEARRRPAQARRSPSPFSPRSRARCCTG